MSRPEQSRVRWVPVDKALDRLRAAHSRLKPPLPRITIAGAGIAGLAAAYELGSLGYPVEIFEGSGRIGGRIFTHRFDDGTWIERGAMRIPSVHDYTFHYFDKAGVSGDLFEFINNNPHQRGLFDVDDVQQTESAFGPWACDNYELNDEEKKRFCNAETTGAGLGALIGYYFQPVFKDLDEEDLVALIKADFSRPKLPKLDKVSLESELQRQIACGRASTAGVALVGKAASLSAVSQWSLAALLRDELHQDGTARFLGLRGGMSRFPEALAAKLPSNVKVYRETQVIDITRNSSGGGHLVLRDGNGTRPHRFDHLLCTLPFPVMRKMTLATFSQPKRAAIQGLRYAPAAKVFFHYRERWWEFGEFGGIRGGGRSVSDQDASTVTLPRQLYYPWDRLSIDAATLLDSPVVPEVSVTTADGVDLRGLFQLYAGSGPDLSGIADAFEGSPKDAPDPGALLAAYVINQGAEEVRDQTEQQTLHRVQAAVNRLHGSRVPRHAAYDVWSWDKYEWSQGALAITPPRDLITHAATARAAEGRVFFAGEHVSIAPGWIQGSLESSLRETAALLETIHAD